MGPPPVVPLVSFCECRTTGIFKAASPPVPEALLVGAVGTTPNDVCGPTAISPRPNGGGGGAAAESGGKATLVCGGSVTAEGW